MGETQYKHRPGKLLTTRNRAEDGQLRKRQMDLSALRAAARDSSPVEGLTHGFYRYPARFSPAFAATAIREFSNAGDLVCDPFMGGGTTVVEALAAGRRVVGTDINSLAAFVTRTKISILSTSETLAVEEWATRLDTQLSYRSSSDPLHSLLEDARSLNLHIPRARAIKKAVASALAFIGELPTARARNFARCALLRTGQWALDNRKRLTPLADFRGRFLENLASMLISLKTFSSTLRRHSLKRPTRLVLQHDARDLDSLPVFKDEKADLFVTSPPYPGVHVLYHRWQVDGRRESPAPYWIADCEDGQGGAHYTFGDRRQTRLTGYFDTLFASLQAIHRVLKQGALIVQMVAFSKQSSQLRRYLAQMEMAGFVEASDARRIWRSIPNRKWHANFKGHIASSREVVLVHRAV